MQPGKPRAEYLQREEVVVVVVSLLLCVARKCGMRKAQILTRP